MTIPATRPPTRPRSSPPKRPVVLATPPVRWSTRYDGYGLDADGRPVSARYGGLSAPRVIGLERGCVTVRHKGRTLKMRLDQFARECGA